jgi:hypothetical protein
VDEPNLRSPLARAVVPVLGGVAFFVVLGLILWGVAVFTSRNPEDVKLGDQTFVVSRVDRLSDRVAADGPVLFPDLKSKAGTRSVIIDHVGGEDATGWVIYNPFPADRGDDCIVTQREHTRQFVDCAGRVLDVSQLRKADDVTYTVDDKGNLVLVLAGATAATTPTT